MSEPRDELLDHDYDGIREFDNPLPKWWLYLFYGSIVFAIVYIPIYHFGPGNLPKETWEADMTQWWKDHPPPELASHQELEAMANDPAFVAAGQATFNVRCVACHAADGGGTVGPNLTDDYTLYGYDRDQIVAVIYHGTKAGMLSWKDQLSLEQIYQVGAYVHTLRGTTPAKPKAAEGVPIRSQGEDAAVADASPEPAPAAAPTPAATPEAAPAPSAGEGAAAEPTDDAAVLNQVPAQVPAAEGGAEEGAAKPG